MIESKIIIYGTFWCGDCRRAKRIFDKYSIEYIWINIDIDSEGEKIVRELNSGPRIIPVIIFPDGTHLIEPSNQDLIEKLKFIK